MPITRLFSLFVLTIMRLSCPPSVGTVFRYNTSDANAILVNTGTNDDPEKRLSSHYHFDAPSIIIVGKRIAVVSSIDRSYVACIILFL